MAVVRSAPTCSSVSDASYQAYGHPDGAKTIERYYVKQRESDSHDRIRAAANENVVDLSAHRRKVGE